ncbi:MAG: tyrosine-type recombinase/integrase [Ruminococcus sp.]|nr:tyrosine-type recombinase/integrase [Ruminococcus sp.]
MNTRDFIDFIPLFFTKLENDGMSQPVIETNKWIVNHFKDYCVKNSIEEVNMEVIKDFYRQQYNIDIYDIKCPMQTVLRRPLLIFMEYYETGTYYKTHQKSVKTVVTENYFDVFVDLQKNFINNQDIVIKNKERKLWVLAKFFNHLDENGIKNIKDLKISDVSDFINHISNDYAAATMRIHKTVLRESLDWLNCQNYISFNGREAFPLIRRDNRRVLLTTYTEDEIARILNVIDTSTPNGKAAYLMISLVSYLGMRAGDVINLKFENIDWENDNISFIQSKTKKSIALPLIDEVKYPLLDYLKNGRHPSADEEFILTSLYAPYTKINSASTIRSVITRAMDAAGVSYEGKKHGSHALRHSLATNMINNNVPISSISDVLGHSNSKVTEIYITKDTTHLRELSLEVPYAL